MISPQSFYEGGFAFGAGTVTLAAGANLPNPTLAPGTPVRCHRLIVDSDTAAGAFDDSISTFTLDDQDIQLVINPANTLMPATTCYPDSVVNPTLGFIAQRDSAVTITRTNMGGGAAGFQAQAGFRCSVANPNVNLGVEGSTLDNAPQDTGTGRLLALGGSVGAGDAGATRTGTPLSARDLLLFHLVVQAELQSMEITAIQIDDYDFLTGGTLPIGFCAADNPAFSFRGARVTKSNTITVTTNDPLGAAGVHAEGITAQVV
jgi:hypothetical protein